MENTTTNRINVLGVGINATSPEDAVERLLAARSRGERGYVCVTSVHGVMESQRDPELRRIHNRSLMTVPDGMPTVWMGQEYGFTRMRRVYGPDLMLSVCEAGRGQRSEVRGQRSEDRGQRVEVRGQRGGELTSDFRSLAFGEKSFTHFLYGATEEKLAKLKANLEEWYPGIQIVGTYAPPFRPLTENEERELRKIVADCKPDFFWVGLSTPKQERFMARHAAAPLVKNRSKDSLKVVESRLKSLNGEHGQRTTDDGPQTTYELDAGIMIGVGAAFDIHSGMLKDAPQWIKNAGLQWFYRLCSEPRRLWRRYLWIVPGFIWLAFLQVMGLRKWEIGD